MDQIGVLFDMQSLGPDQAAQKAWRIFLRHCKGDSLAATTLYGGEIHPPEGISGKCFCIAVYSDDPDQLKYVAEKMAAAPEGGLLPPASRLMNGPVTDDHEGPHALARLGEVDLGGRLVTETWKHADEQLCKETGWEYAPASVDNVIQQYLFKGPTPAHRVQAARLVAKYGSGKCIEALRKHLATEKDPSAHKACQEAIEKLQEADGEADSAAETDPMEEVFKPMMLKFNCPKCRKEYQVEAKYAGRSSKCKNCGEAFTIPSATPAARTPAVNTDADNVPAAMFRGNARHTGQYDTTGRDRPPQVRWKFQASGPVNSSPVAFDGMIYVGSEDGNLYAVDAATGQAKWQFEIGTPVSSSPAVAGGAVFVGGKNGTLYALEIDSGLLRWEFRAGGAVHSPVFVCETVIAGSSDGNIYAVDAASGKLKWRHATEFPVAGSPAISMGMVFYCNAGGMIGAVDFATGKAAWYIGVSGRLSTSPTVAYELAFFTAEDGTVYALDPNSGAENWRFKIEGHIQSSPAASQKMLFFGGLDGKFYALDAKSGALVWKSEEGGPYTSSASVVDDTVYVGGGDGNFLALDIETGKALWRIPAGGPVMSSPCVDDGVVYAGGPDGNLYALGDPLADASKQKEDHLPMEESQGPSKIAPSKAAQTKMKQASSLPKSADKSGESGGPLSLSDDEQGSQAGGGEEIDVPCMICSKSNKITPDKVGQIIKCGHCGGKFKVRPPGKKK